LTDSADLQFMGEEIPIDLQISETYPLFAGMFPEGEGMTKFKGILTALIWLAFLWGLFKAFSGLFSSVGSNFNVKSLNDGD